MRVLPALRGSLFVALMLACSSERALGPTAELPRSGPVFDLNNTTGPFLVITEIMPNPAALNDEGEYIEVFNAGAAPVNMQNMSLRSANGSGGQITSIPITTSVPVASGACVILSTHATIPGVTVAFAYGTNGSMMFTNSSAIDYMEIVSGTEVVDRVQAAFNPTNSNGFGYYLDVSPLVDITTIDNSRITTTSSGTTGLAIAPWKKAVTGDLAFGLNSAERGTPGTCNYKRHATPGDITAVSVTDATIGLGATTTLTATADGGTGEITYVWTSDNGAVSVDRNTGAVTGNALGTANVTATAPNGVSGSAVVRVVDVNAVDHINVSIENNPPFTIGYTRRAFASVFNVLGTQIFPEITWSTADASIATVDSRRYVTARGVPAGLSRVTTQVIATVGGVSGSADVIVQTPLFKPEVQFQSHVEFGVPVDADPSDDIRLDKRQYSLSYSVSRGGPNWVSWDINATHLGSRPRCDCFTADVDLLTKGVSAASLIEDYDYVDAGYDRGHMVQSASSNVTDAENAPTYLMTNIIPQAADNNQGPWQDIEEFANDFARAGQEVYVMAGGIYGPNPQTLKGLGRVQIPDYTWKVVVVTNRFAGVGDVDYFDDLQVYAFKLPNIVGVAKRRDPKTEPVDYWKKYLTTVDAIEAETGYDVLSKLPDDIENPIEAGDKVPVASMIVPSTTVEGSSIFLDARGSTDGDGDALTYTWTLSDGTVLTGATATATFADNGSKTVTLTVRDPLGAWNTKTTTVQVTNAAPVASFTVDQTSVVSGESLSFTGSFTDAGVVDQPWNWTISWGDGSVTSSNESAVPASVKRSHQYFNTGPYTVTFTVTDHDGESSTRATVVNVVRRNILIDVSPEAINDNDIGNARVKVEAYSDDTFDASLVDLATACIGTVCVDERGNSGKVFAELRDADDDGDLDLVMRFERRALVKSGALASPGSEVIFRADLTDGRQVEGRTTVLVH